MKYFLFGAFFLLANWSIAQTDTLAPIMIAEEMPRFPGCEALMDADKDACAQQKLLSFIYKNIAYPDTAVVNNIEGTVVVRFVVTKEGKVANPSVLKDIVYGCGDEALRVVNGMNKIGIEWIPGQQDDEAVDVYFTLPIRFRIEEPLPYMILQGDTIWTSYDQAATYKGGEEALQKFILSNLKYPESGLDSCEVGAIACDVLIRKNGQAIVMSMHNYSGLNQDFEFEVIRVASKTTDQWNIAQLDGQPVAVVYPLRFSFRPTSGDCLEKATAFDQATILADEGVQLYNSGNKEEAYNKWAESIERFPKSVEVNFFRGQAYLDEENFEGACADFKAVKKVLGNSGYDSLLPIICK